MDGGYHAHVLTACAPQSPAAREQWQRRGRPPPSKVAWGAGRMDALCVAMLVASAALTPAAAVGGVETHQRSWGALAAPAVGGVHRDATLTAPASAPLMALRLKGGRGCTGTRNSCKQRGYHINAGVQKNAKRNKPIALSHKPCSGPHAPIFQQPHAKPHLTSDEAWRAAAPCRSTPSPDDVVRHRTKITQTAL